jgi:hypothetical protein
MPSFPFGREVSMARRSKSKVLAAQLKRRNCGAALDIIMSMSTGAERRAAKVAFKRACVVGKQRAVADLKYICGIRKVSKKHRKH